MMLLGHCWFSKRQNKSTYLRENEEYALVVDGHSLFAKGWDTMCLDKHDKADAINLQKQSFTVTLGIMF